MSRLFNGKKKKKKWRKIIIITRRGVGKVGMIILGSFQIRF